MHPEIFFELGVGTRMRRLLARMSVDVDRVYQDAGFDFRVSDFPVVYGVAELGEMSITDIAELAGFSHSAASQRVKRMVQAGWLETVGTEDGRRRMVRLTSGGRAQIEALRPLWQELEVAMRGALAETDVDLLAAVAGLEHALGRRSLSERLRQRRRQREQRNADFTIEPWDVRHAEAFRSLNLAWVEKYFEVEPIDLEVLDDPEGTILAHGGEVFFAVDAGRTVGAVAMKLCGPGRFELTKLGVDPALHRGGMGEALCRRVIERFLARGGEVLFLETNTVLEPAIRLYHKLDFVHLEPPEPSPYLRSNYYMEWRGSQPAD